MSSRSINVAAAVSILAVSLVASRPAVAGQSTIKSTETKTFEVIAVDGNKVVVKGVEGTKEITVTDAFRLTVAGKPVSVHDLKPGMKGTATITTTVTETPVYVTEVKKVEIVRAMSTSVIVRGEDGINKLFTQDELNKKGVRIYKDGKLVDIFGLKDKDRLTATIVTAGPPEVLTDRQVQAALSAAPPPPPPSSTVPKGGSVVGGATVSGPPPPTPAAPPPATTAPAPTASPKPESAPSSSAPPASAPAPAPASAPASSAAAGTSPLDTAQEGSSSRLIWIAGIALLALLAFFLLRKRRAV